MAREQLTFAVYLIHALAASWGKTTGETYSIFKKSGVLANYINPCYDTLHTLGTNYLGLQRVRHRRYSRKRYSQATAA